MEIMNRQKVYIFIVGGRGMNDKPIDLLNRVRDILDKMKLNYAFREDIQTFIIPFGFETSRGKVRANILVKASGNWVFTIAPLLNIKHIPRDSDKLKLYERLLMDTYYLNEVTYGLTRNGDIVVHAETHKDALTPENFEVEFYSVVYGIKYFIDKIMPEFMEYEEKTYLQYIH